MTDYDFDFIVENLVERKRIARTTDKGRQQSKALGSPKAIQQRNLLAVVVWIYHWGFSTGDIISDLLGRKNRSHARRMEKNGWLRKVEIKGYPVYHTLTDKGLALAENESPAPKLLPYPETDPYKVHMPTLHHDLMAQQETIKALKHGWYHDYLTKRMYNFPAGESGPRKIPDVILLRIVRDELGQHLATARTGIEIELNTKRGYKLDLFATDILDDIQNLLYDRFIIVTDSNAVLKHYEPHFKPNTKIKLWDFSKIKPVATGKVYDVPDWSPKYVVFRKLDSNLPYEY